MNRELEQPKVWDKPERAQELGRERARLEAVVVTFRRIDARLSDANELLELARAEDDASMAEAIATDLKTVDGEVAELEFRRMFSGEMVILLP